MYVLQMYTDARTYARYMVMSIYIKNKLVHAGSKLYIKTCTAIHRTASILIMSLTKMYAEEQPGKR